MVNSALRRNAVFVAGWALAGLATAFVVNQLWSGNGSVRPQPDPAATTAIAAPASSTASLAPAVPKLVTTQVGDAQGIGTTPADPAPAISSYAPAVTASSPAVVSIYVLRKETITNTEDPNYPREFEALREGLGSGVIMDAQGHIVTNDHVIKNAVVINGTDRIYVQLADGRGRPATVVGKDPETDLALLKIDLTQLPVMPMGRSDRLAVGDVVLAIGNPYGLSQTVTQGIVSATGRTLNGGIAPLESFIQTDAAINFGNSGGALINARGELVGINTAVLGSDNQGAYGLGVAIPVDLVRGVVREIVQNGRVVRGYIGIKPENLNAQNVQELNRAGIAAHPGVIINRVALNSPAAQAGLMRFDMIEAIDGQPVVARGAQDAYARIASRKPGTSIKISVTRNNQPLNFDVKVVEQPPAQP